MPTLPLPRMMPPLKRDKGKLRGETLNGCPIYHLMRNLKCTDSDIQTQYFYLFQK